MNFAEFIDKWRKVELTELSAAQQQFLDLFDLLDYREPSFLVVPLFANEIALLARRLFAGLIIELAPRNMRGCPGHAEAGQGSLWYFRAREDLGRIPLHVRQLPLSPLQALAA